MFIAAIYNCQILKQPKCSLADKLINWDASRLWDIVDC